MKKSIFGVFGIAFSIALSQTSVAQSAFQSKYSNPNSYTPTEEEFDFSNCANPNHSAVPIEQFVPVPGVSSFDFDKVNRLGASTGAFAVSLGDGTSSVCSGTLISEDLFLTASHCIYPGTIGSNVFFDYQENGSTGGIRNAGLYGRRVIGIAEDGVNVNLDYAVLRLAYNPGYATNYWNIPGLETTDPRGWRTLNTGVAIPAVLAHHPEADTKHASIAQNYITKDADHFYSLVDISRGSSGAGLVDRFGRVFGVLSAANCTTGNTPTKVGLFVSMSSILAVSQVLQAPSNSAQVSNVIVEPYTGFVLEPQLFSSRPTGPSLTSINIDSGVFVPVSWDKPYNAHTRVEISVNGGSWKHVRTYEPDTVVAQLCQSRARQNGTPKGCEKVSSSYSGKNYFRFRSEVHSSNGSVSAGQWRYIRPISFYYDS